jgi:phage major head subunit gpT-like protein
MPIGTGIGANYSSRAIIGRFYERLNATQPPPWVGNLAYRIDSNQSSEDIKWLGMAPVMREWVSGRAAAGFRSNGINVVNKVFEASVEVDVDDIRRDKTGQFMARIDELPVRAQQHRARLLTDLILLGESTACYDGQFFFDTDHAEGTSGTQSNDLAFDISDNGTGGTATAPLANTIQAAVLQAVQAIMGFKDDKGEPMNDGASNFEVHVPVTFMGETIKALTMPLTNGGDSNVLVNNRAFSLTPVINPRLTWTTKLAVYNTDGATKPFIEQVEQDPMMDAIAEGSELEIRDRKHLYTVTRIGNVAYGMWQKACLVTLAA